MKKTATKKMVTIKVQKRDAMGRFAHGFTTKRVATTKKATKRSAR